MRLRTALRIEDGEIVALVGAAAPAVLFRLADDIVEAGGRVIATTLATIPATLLDRAPKHFSAFEVNRAQIEAALHKHPQLFITGPVDRTLDKAPGVSAGLLEDLQAVPDLSALLVLVEHDQLPHAATRVLSVQSLGSSLPALSHERVSVLLDTTEGEEPASHTRAAALLQDDSVEVVLIGSPRKINAIREAWARVGAVVLAAGRSTRMGQSKQLLPWGNSTLLGEVVQRLRATGVHDIVVVTGAEREAVERVVSEAALGDARVRCVFNPDYATSEMARSLQTGLRALKLHYHAAVVALADQPQIQPATVEAVLQRWRETLAPMVAPFRAGKRGHPMLFDRAQWPQLLALPADANPRAVLQTAEGLEAVAIASDTILTDIDTPTDYAQARTDQDKR
ncbi:MAG: nucleotidyltransferase family protein [Anaerolineales bacterium]